MKYLSLKKAAKISGYNPDYLGYLIRKKKLGGKRIGRDWFTTEKALQAYLVERKFIPVGKFLSFKIGHRLFFFLFVGIMILGIVFVAVLYSSPSFSFQKIGGDFEERAELQRKKILIEETKNQAPKELEITTYSSDEAGGIEISVEPE